jgi:tRNA pseudouridine38/39 synthase
MDLQRMRQASRLFIGEHDFRNFCKLDLSKVTSHRRTIVAFDVQQLEPHRSQHAPHRGRLCELRVRGFAFLWHQVSSIVGAHVRQVTRARVCDAPHR